MERKRKRKRTKKKPRKKYYRSINEVYVGDQRPSIMHLNSKWVVGEFFLLKGKEEEERKEE